MARKSRKPSPQGKPVVVNIPIDIAVGYVRLSVEDRAGEGDSIETQKRIISSYIENSPNFQLSRIYEDDGASGSTYDRPGFSEMIGDAEKGKFSCVLIKDISRLGRNLIDTGYYVEKKLPSLGIRLISITDGYDSVRDGINTIFALKSLLNEVYPQDIGHKVKSVIHNQMEDGRYFGNRPPYGFLKSSKDKHRLVMDETAAPVVQQIFQWAAEGKSMMEIVRSLNSEGIPTPSHHWFRLGIIDNMDMLGGKHWQTRTVRSILKNEIYTGTMLRGKTEVSQHKQVPAPSDAWLHIENAHPAIISKGLFTTVQEQLFSRQENAPGQQNEHYTPNLFKGKIFCGYCGKNLDRKKNHQYYIYRCTAKYAAPGSCLGISVREDTLVEAVTGVLLEYATRVDDKPHDLQDEKAIETKLAELQVESSYDEGVLIGLYEAFVIGEITKQEYLDAKADYSQWEVQQKERWAQLSLQKSEKADMEAEKRGLNDMLVDFQNTKLLTPELIDRLVEKVSVHDSGKVYVALKNPGCLRFDD